MAQLACVRKTIFQKLLKDLSVFVCSLDGPLTTRQDRKIFKRLKKNLPI